MSDKEIFIKSNDRKIQDYISPSIIFQNGIYRIWYIHRKIFYFEKDGKNFTSPWVLDINYNDDYHILNIDIIYNEVKKVIWINNIPIYWCKY